MWEDEFGVRWDRRIDRDIGVVVNRLVTPGTLDDYSFPDPDEPELYRDFETGASMAGDTLVLAKLSYNLFERAWSLVGMEDLLTYMIADKGFVHAVMDRIAQYNLRVIENVFRWKIDGVFFGDDWGQQGGMIMGPALWREFVKPRIAEMYGAAKKRGGYVFIHSCGRVQEIFPDLIECGLDCFNPFQPEVMDVFEIKKAYGDRLSFYGGISTQRTLPFGTAEETRDEVRRLLDSVGAGGGYIASPAHAVPGDAKAENVAAMIEVLQEQ
ncbi:MAG: uroporphyrinogen decarboxylase family protein [Planctomycetota bacterium]